MSMVLKITGFFTLVVLMLSITVNGKPLFSHIYNVISPATTTAQEVAESLFDSSVKAGRNLTHKLFDNSVPKLKDSVRSRQAAPAKPDGTPAEFIKPEEKEELDELIKSHH